MEFTTSKRANTELNQNHETHMQIQEHFTELSIRLSEVLDNSGAGKDTVMERRGSYLWLKRMANLHTQLTGYNFECFHFGSQSEGTTIPGLQSDIDILFSNNSVNIMRVWGDWEPGMENFMMLHDETTPPQQYLLQVISKETPKPETGLCDDTVRKDSRQVLYSAERYLSDLENTAKNIAETTKSGPSVSFIPNWDMVYAFHVRKPLHEILHWIDRCKYRHWPPVLLLEAASVAPCFLVPSGHPDSDYKREEWRLSPNLIERMLIFSFNMTQIKCYNVLKLIKKSLFAKIVGDSITSFHCKTIMFYTMERTHPSLWFEHNLMYLLLHCLRMLRTWLRFGRLPHYIIQGVNLFDGKLSKVKQRRLLVYIDSMIRNNLQDVFNIDIENIGCRLQGCYIRRIGQTRESERLFVCNSINIQLNYECFKTFLGWCKRIIHVNQINNSNTTFEKTIQYVLRNAVECSTNARLKNVALVFLKHVHRLQISMQSSDCLRLRKVVTKELIRRFQYSLNTDVASSHLKLASVLYCSGHIIAAVRVLEDVERRFHNRVKAVCECRSIEGQSDLHVFANITSL
ncbi:uncharacterized protein LOC127849909 [Dreissena polymorpha]|nr:uncharacterized protein LOC127849909 [Dreissena polymorpha]